MDSTFTSACFPEEFRTQRLILRRMCEKDLADVARFYRNEQAMEHLGGVRTIQQIDEWHARQVDHWWRHGWGWWVVHDLATDEFIGRGGIKHVDDYGDEVELGFGLLPNSWGRGLATEMALATIRLGFELLQLCSIISFTAPTNARSRRVIEKAGLHYERDIVRYGFPYVLFRLTYEEWREQNEQS